MDFPSERGSAQVFYYQAIALSAGVFVTIVTVQVALARRARWIGAVVFAVVVLLAMTGVAYGSIRTAFGPDAASNVVVQEVLRVSASLYGVVLLAITSAALWLARRDHPPRPSSHWVMTAAAGLIVYFVAIQVRSVFAVDIMTATDDGMGPRGVMHPTPEERMARAQTLPACSIRALAPRNKPAWHWQTVRPVAATLPMPAEMHDEPDEVPDDPGIQQWGIERWGTIVLQLDTEAQQSSGFFIGGGPGTTSEPPCALRIGSRLVPITRSASVVRRRGGSGTDSMFTATTDVPIALPDTQLGVGITARTRAGRDTLLAILAAMRFTHRETGR
jgi:hypothetical protein